jgi:Tol biopolymer transport system component
MPSWSRDGKWIYFNSDRDGTVRIWKRRSTGGEAIPVTRRRSYWASESPDGKTVYFLPPFEEPGIYQVPVGGGGESVLPGTEAHFVRWDWTVSKDGVFFAANGRGPVSIFFYRFATGKIELVRRLHRPRVEDMEGLAVDPNHNLLLFSQGDERKSGIMIARDRSR